MSDVGYHFRFKGHLTYILRLRIAPYHLLLPFILLASSFILPCSAQDTTYARRILNLLASPEYYGRGYVNHGDRKAARYLAAEFERLGLEKAGKSYFQHYNMPVNTFPGKTEVSIDGKKLTPGTDFLVSANTGRIRGTFGLVWMTDTNLTVDKVQNIVNGGDYHDKFIVVSKKMDDLVKKKEIDHVKGVIILREKGLSWALSNSYRTRDFVLLEVARGSLPESASAISLNIDNRFYGKYKTQNVIGIVRGSEKPDSFLVFTAHYDHLGMMGPALFPGANDNASGTAMVLDLAKHYSMPENRPRYSMAFMLFSAEETGLRGSGHYAAHPFFPLSRIVFLMNLDMVGTGSKGIKVVNGSSHERLFNRLAAMNKEKNYLAEVGKRDAAANSDHHPFAEKGVPAVFIYTMGDEFREYHNLKDLPQTLPLSRYMELFRLLTDFMKTF